MPPFRRQCHPSLRRTAAARVVDDVHVVEVGGELHRRAVAGAGFGVDAAADLVPLIVK